ncbi:MAG: TlpA family protein disulfide reductase [Alphaproteobacteria bacterium]|nr:TlpA family protein disulfide reductase [Alphaproteobacteria bacterium]
MNWKVLLIGVVLVVPLVVVLALGFGHDPRALPTTMVDRPAPGFVLADMDTGEQVDLAALRGKPVVINFASSWCVPCAQEHPWLVRVARDYQPRGVVFLNVLYNDEPIKWQGFLARYGQSFPTLVDPGGRVAIDYGVAGVPETFVLDDQGNIVRKFTGPVVPDEFLPLLDGLL